MDTMDEQSANSEKVKHLQPYQYQKGQSGNPNGRPKGTISLKQYAKRMLEQMSPEERETFMEGLDKKFIWEMAEGKAEAKTESKVEVTLPQPLLSHVPTNDSVEQDTEAQEED